MPEALHAVLGIGGLIAIAWLAGEDRRRVPWRAVLSGLALLVFGAAISLRIPAVKGAFLRLNDALLVLERATQAGTGLVFGYLGGAPAPFAVTDQNALFVLAFRALPIVLVMSALSALLFYWRVLPAVVHALSWLLRKSMGIGGV
ncbi:MAG TPA: Na+ dependent nucleoside transporter N-terminal domain-containing protein, partial [Burkholderiales bacterium]|nr:Na+ dependent nucleoside transporter N-terminal domain-containing protein [Burkholderiales bacterium]